MIGNTPFGLSLSKPCPRHRAARQAVRLPLIPTGVFGPRANSGCCKGLCGWGLRRDLEALSSAGLRAARFSALRKLTHGNCPSAAGAARVASFAVRPQVEQHRAVGPTGRPLQLTPQPPPAQPFAAAVRRVGAVVRHQASTGSARTEGVGRPAAEGRGRSFDLPLDGGHPGSPMTSAHVGRKVQSPAAHHAKASPPARRHRAACGPRTSSTRRRTPGWRGRPSLQGSRATSGRHVRIRARAVARAG